MKQDVFIKTDNVLRAWEAIMQVEDVQKGQPGLCLFHGSAGRGKTVAVENYYTLNGGVYLRVWQDWTQNAFMQALCFKVTGRRVGPTQRCKEAVCESLDNDRRTLFVDEADRLHLARIEDLRDIHDSTGCPVILVGEEELKHLIDQKSRVSSRVTAEVEFGPVSGLDISMYAEMAAGLDLGNEEAELLSKRTNGDFRLVHNGMIQLEQMAKAAQSKTVTMKMVENVRIIGRSR